MCVFLEYGGLDCHFCLKKPMREIIQGGMNHSLAVPCFWLKVDKCLLKPTFFDTFTPMENSPPTTRVKERKEAKERKGLRPSLFPSRI